jgi:hypothetical protein
MDDEGFRVSMLLPKLQTPDICLRAVRNMTGTEDDMRQLLASMPPQIGRSREILLATVQLWTSLLSELGPLISPNWQRDRELLRSLLQFSPYFDFGDTELLQWFPTFADDVDMVEAAVRKQGTCALRWASGFQTDRRIALLALEREPSGAGYVSSTLWKDPTFISEAVQLNRNVLLWATEWLNQEWALEAVRQFPRQALRMLPDVLRRNQLIWSTALSANPLAIASLPEDLCTFSLMEKAIQQDPRAFALVPRWFPEKTLALQALGREGLLLGHWCLQKRWSQDRDVVLAAVKQNGLALEFASEELKMREEVLEAALRQNGLALAFAGKYAKHCEDLVRIAVRQNPYALAFSNRCRHLQRPNAELPPLPVSSSAPFYAH